MVKTLVVTNVNTNVKGVSIRVYVLPLYSLEYNTVSIIPEATYNGKNVRKCVRTKDIKIVQEINSFNTFVFTSVRTIVNTMVLTIVS